MYVPRLEPTAPIRLADRNHAHYPSRRSIILKKGEMAQGRTSSTHVSIHTGVIGKCNLHIHLTHQNHGVAGRFSPLPKSWGFLPFVFKLTPFFLWIMIIIISFIVIIIFRILLLPLLHHLIIIIIIIIIYYYCYY